MVKFSIDEQEMERPLELGRNYLRWMYVKHLRQGQMISWVKTTQRVCPFLCGYFLGNYEEDKRNVLLLYSRESPNGHVDAKS